jgi:hypothetical protein
MTTMLHTSSRQHDSVLLDGRIDDLLLRLRGLVLVRGLLEQRGASPEELDAHAREAERVRAKLALLVEGGGDPVGGLAA